MGTGPRVRLDDGVSGAGGIALDGPRDRIGFFASREIAVGRFSGRTHVAPDADDVVLDLKREAKKPANVGTSFNVGRTRRGRARAERAARRKERCGFAGNHVEVCFDRRSFDRFER